MQSIKNDAENKILILYTLNVSSIPLTSYDLSIIILDNLLMNYFTFNQSLNDLVDGHYVEYDENFVDITEQGKNMLKLFSGSLDSYKKLIIDNYMELNKKKVSMSNAVSTEVIALDTDKFQTMLILKEKNDELLRICIEVPSFKMAEAIKNNFQEDPYENYKQILNILMKQ